MMTWELWRPRCVSSFSTSDWARQLWMSSCGSGFISKNKQVNCGGAIWLAAGCTRTEQCPDLNWKGYVFLFWESINDAVKSNRSGKLRSSVDGVALKFVG